MAEVASITVGFVLTTIARGWWASRLQQRSWQRQNQVRLHEEEARRSSDQAQRERQYQSEVLTSLLNRLQTVYSEVKRRRRLLRLVARAELSKQTYRDAMLEVSDYKQTIEQLWHDMRALTDWLPELEAVWPDVDSMERYLNQLENEWEETGPTPEEAFPATELGALDRFLAKPSSGRSAFRRVQGSVLQGRRRV